MGGAHSGTCWGVGALTDFTVFPWPPELLCLSNEMQVYVSRSYLQSLGYSASDLVIPNWNGVYQCQPHITSSQVTFTIPHSGCGTTQQVNLGLPTLPPTEKAFLQ